MNKFIHKVQDLQKKAAQFKHVIEAAPGKAAELREAVLMTAGEFQQLRTDVQTNLGGLRANSEDRIIEAMREITEHTGTFQEAGYVLAGMDLDFSLSQRLAVQLEKFEDVPHSTLRALLANQKLPTIRAILGGLIKAEETAANVELSGLTYEALIVHVGAAPTIRMCWRNQELHEEGEAPAAHHVATTPPITTPPPLPSSPAFGSFFEQRTIPAHPAPTTPAPISTPVPSPVAHTEHAMHPAVASVHTSGGSRHETAGDPAKSHWSKESLERFKKMPGASKYRRS